jgi:hypothetical protein
MNVPALGCTAPTFLLSLLSLQPIRRLIALGLVLLLLPMTPDGLFAQQAWPQNNQYIQYARPTPGYAQYPPNQQPAYSQQPDSQQNFAAPPYPGPEAEDPQGAYGQTQAQPFAPDQLEQLVAPIALYPDALIAQILAAATYPAQIAAADQWLRALGNAPPEQIAAAADAQSTWDPSVKALTAFPQVLAMMDQDLAWATDLGNAYYNQPQDVLQTIQVLRRRAQTAGNLESTPQQQVSDDRGYIQLAPANPQVVYVPTYNPWYAYGAPIDPYPGFSFVNGFGEVVSTIGEGIVFGLGIAIGAFFHAGFGWLGWGLDWGHGFVSYHHSPWYSHSQSVARWDSARGGHYGARQAGMRREFLGARGGRGSGFADNRSLSSFNRQSNGFGRQNTGRQRYGGYYARGSGTERSDGYSARSFDRQQSNAYGAQGFNRGQSNGYIARGFDRQAIRAPQSYGYPRLGETPSRAYAGGYARPAVPEAYGHPQAQMPSRGYTPYSSPQQSWRTAEPSPQRSFSPRSFGNERSYSAPSRGFAGASPRPEHSSGFHFFGGGHGGESYHAPKAPKAPKSSGGGRHSGGGGFFHHNKDGGRHH